MNQPPAFVDPHKPNHVFRLKKALYGLRHAPQVWFDRFNNYLLTLGFFCSTVDYSMFICRNNQGTIILLLYVDDMIITSDNQIFLELFISQLSKEFSMKDLGFIHFFSWH